MPLTDSPDPASDRLEILRQLAKDEPDDATTQFLLGRELMDRGLAAEAVTAFENATRSQPDYAAAYRQLGNALESAGRPDEAKDIYLRGVEVAERTQDLQAAKEMKAFLKRLARDRGVAP